MSHSSSESQSYVPPASRTGRPMRRSKTPAPARRRTRAELAATKAAQSYLPRARLERDARRDGRGRPHQRGGVPRDLAAEDVRTRELTAAAAADWMSG